MENVLRSPEVNGVAPSTGLVCSAFKVLHFYENAQIVDLANVTYLCLDDTWFRLYFEPGVVFWRCDGAPQIPTNCDLASGLLLNDLSDDDRIVGKQLQAISCVEESDRTVVRLGWSGESSLKFVHSHTSGNTDFVIEQS